MFETLFGGWLARSPACRVVIGSLLLHLSQDQLSLNGVPYYQFESEGARYDIDCMTRRVPLGQLKYWRQHTMYI